MATSPNRSHVGLLQILITLLFITVLIKVAILMLASPLRGRTYTDPAVAQRVERGTILDRNGRILAIQTPHWGVYFHLNAIEDLPFVSDVVAPFVQMSSQQIIERASLYTTYALIKDRIDEQTAAELGQALAKNRLQNQVSIEKREGRSWPAHFHGSQVIGFTNSSGEGIEGIELSQEQYLNPWPQVGDQLVTYGDEITLTLDLDIQYAVDVQLQAIADAWEPQWSAAIVLDATTGDILALGSWPWYDANRYAASSADQRRSNAVNALSEPGSVFKLFSLASILKAGQAHTDEPFFCDGSYTFNAGGRAVTITCSSAHGKVDPQTMISKSCNGAIAHWALETDTDAFYKGLVDLGFTSAWDIDLPSKARSMISEPSLWSARSKPTIAFGQELLTTALHIAVAATALGPQGVLLAPHLIYSRRSTADGTLLYRRTPTPVAQVFDPAITQTIREGMAQAATEGTGTRAQVDGVKVGIKTGTAQTLNVESGTYTDGALYASALAMVPIDEPRYIIYVGSHDPKGSDIWGANIAAPAIGAIIRSLVSQGKLVPSRE